MYTRKHVHLCSRTFLKKNVRRFERINLRVCNELRVTFRSVSFQNFLNNFTNFERY
jgi:hypothetical protein